MKKIDIDVLYDLSFLISFLSIICIRNIYNINIPIIISTIIVSLYMFFSHRNITEIMAFLIPFRSAIQGNYITLIALIIYLIKNDGKITIKKDFFLLLIVIIIELFNCVNEYSSLKEYFIFVDSLLLIYIFVHKKINYNEGINIIKNCVFGICFTFLIYFIKTFKSVSFSKFLVFHYRLGLSNLDYVFSNYNLKFNANEIALYALLSITFLLFLKYKNEIRGFWFYILLIFSIIIGTLSMSRAFVLILLIITFFYIFSLRKNIKKLLLSFVLCMIGIAVLFAYNKTFFDGVILNYKSRFEVNDLTGGRSAIISDYNNIIFSSPKKMLFGSGAQNYSDKNNMSHASHNATQEIFIAWGMLGGLSFLLLVFSYYNYTVAKKSYNMFFYLPLMSFVFMIQTIPFIAQGIIILLIYVVLTIFKLNDNVGDNYV